MNHSASFGKPVARRSCLSLCAGTRQAPKALLRPSSLAPFIFNQTLLITLPPGAYTAAATGASCDTGVAIVEVYEVP
jgi:hypothetical protein